MKGIKLIISLASAIVVVGAAICAVVIFQEELMKLWRDCCDYCTKPTLTAEEIDDFADL